MPRFLAISNQTKGIPVACLLLYQETVVNNAALKVGPPEEGDGEERKDFVACGSITPTLTCAKTLPAETSEFNHFFYFACPCFHLPTDHSGILALRTAETTELQSAPRFSLGRAEQSKNEAKRMDKFVQFITEFFSKNERYFLLIIFFCDWGWHRVVLPLSQYHLQYQTWRIAIIRGFSPYVKGPYESEVGVRNDSNNPLLPIDENTAKLLEQADLFHNLLFLSWIVVLIVVVVLVLGYLFWLRKNNTQNKPKDQEDRQPRAQSPLDQFQIGKSFTRWLFSRVTYKISRDDV